MSALFINGALFAVFLTWAIFAPATVRFIVECGLWLFGALVGAEIVSGLVRHANDEPLLLAGHRWAGHLLVILAWAIMGASLAIVIRHFRSARGTAILFCLVSIAAFAFTMLGSFTGYLRPFAPDADPETQNRFFLLHAFVPPIILAIIVPFWIAVLRTFPHPARKGEAAAELRQLATTPSDNPYASPRGD